MNLIKNKHYLTGIDWIIHTLDYASKKETGIGNISQLVLELKGCLEKERIYPKLKKFVACFPVLKGQCRRNYNLAPYWKISSAKEAFSFDGIYLKNYDFNRVFSILSQRLNQPLKGYLSFYLITNQNKSFLAMTFDHRVFDAKGAEAFLMLFAEDNFINRLSAEPSHLCKWQEKFEAGRRVNRKFLSLAKRAPPKTLKRLNDKKNFNFKIITFSKKESNFITQKAYQKAGYLLFVPYLLSVVLKRIEELFAKHDSIGKDYIVSTSIDKRRAQDVIDRLFFNHFSFLFFQLSPKEVKKYSLSLDQIKKQLYQQTKNKFMDNFFKVSFLMRILPVSLLYKIMKVYFKGGISSLSFSYVGNSVYDNKHFLGLEVENIFHMPRVPVPPGVGIFLNQFDGKINFIFSYFSALLSEEHVQKFITNLKNDLLSGHETKV